MSKAPSNFVLLTFCEEHLAAVFVILVCIWRASRASSSSSSRRRGGKGGSASYRGGATTVLEFIGVRLCCPTDASLCVVFPVRFARSLTADGRGHSAMPRQLQGYGHRIFISNHCLSDGSNRSFT